jgi:hypothetical protein
MVTPGDNPAATRKTIELVNSLALSMHYPIGGKEFTEVLRGLLAKYRSMVLQLQDEVQSGTAAREISPSQQQEYDRKMMEIQSELAKALGECNQAKVR